MKGKAMTPPDEDQTDSFGTWLLAQQGHSGWIGDLAKAAKADSQFPRQGSPDDVRAHLNRNQVEGDMFEAVDDAESLWRTP